MKKHPVLLLILLTVAGCSHPPPSVNGRSQPINNAPTANYLKYTANPNHYYQ